MVYLPCMRPQVSDFSVVVGGEVSIRKTTRPEAEHDDVDRTLFLSNE